MALQKNVISIPIFGGVDTKTDEKLLPNGSLRKLVNGVFNKTGRISKRNGYKKTTNNTNIDKTDLQGIWESDDKLVFRDGINFKTKDGSTIGTASSVNAAVDLIAGVTLDPNGVLTYKNSYARYNNFEMYQVNDTDFYIKKDGYVFNKTISMDVYSKVQIHATPMGFLVIYIDSTSRLRTLFYNFNTNSFVGLLPDIRVIANNITSFDACFINNTVFVLYSGAANATFLTGLDMVGDLSPTWGTISTGVTAYKAGSVLRVCGENIDGEMKVLTSVLTSKILIRNDYFLNGANVYNYTVEQVLNADETNAEVFNFVTDLNNGMATHMVSRSTEFMAYFPQPRSCIISNYQRIQNLNTFSMYSSYNYARGLMPAGRSFKINGLTYFPMAYYYAEAPSLDYPTYGYEYGKVSNQPTIFIYDSIGVSNSRTPPHSEAVVGRSLTQNLQDGASMSSVFVDGQKAYMAAVSENNLCSLNLILNNEVKGVIKNGQNLILNTGKLNNFDGTKTFDNGFNTYPEIQDTYLINIASPTGPVMDTGDKVSYQAVFSFKDSYGKVYESSTSIPAQYVMDIPATTGATAAIDVAIYLDAFNQSLSQNNLGGGTLRVDLYRTEVNGSIFYKCKTDYVEISERNRSTWLISDDMNDSELVGMPAIYTTGGILDNETIDNIDGLTSFAGRTIVWSGNTIYFSKQYIDGNPIYFNMNALYVNVPESLGKIKSLAYIDDSLAIFTDIGIYVLSGTAPDNAGLNGALSNFSIISKEMGAVDSQNLITSIGVFFKSPRGLYLLPRGFGAIQYIGAPVEEYNQYKINSMFISQKDTSFYFLLDNKTTLVYNSLYSFWSIFDTFDNRGGCIYKDLVNLLDKDGNILEEAPGTWTHDTKPIKLTIGTQWIKLNGIQGYQRVWRMLLLGNYKSPHKMRVQMAYDYLPYHDPRSERVMDSTAQYQHIYGVGGPYGVGGYALGGPLQWDISPAWQKCEAISFEISDIQDPAGGYGPSFELNDLTIEAGVKAGPMRLPKGKKG